VLSSGQIIRNNNDKFQFVAFTVIDITDKKKVEEKIMKAQKMDSIGSLTMGIAHDFNNMLGGVSGYASILLDEIVDKKRREYLEKIVEITEKANQLTKKLLSFGKTDQSNKCEMDINQSVNEVLLIIKYRIKQNIAIKTEYTDNIDQIEAEPIEINQIIMNLCANGLDAMPNGGILKITTSNFTQKKHDNSLEAGNYVAVAVSDNGCGMSDDLIRKIFEPFFTTKKTNKHSGGGLGLTTSLAIARKMGGNIVVESKIGHGSKFTLFLPAKQIDKQPEDNLLITNKVTKKILLVDNEPTILHMAAIMLNNLGYQAMLASGGREATEKYAMNHANIIGVILDWQMPDMCGTQIIDNIMEINSQAKIIISSGMNEEIVQKEYLPDKVAGLLTKPYNLEQMRQILNKLQQQ